MSAWVASSETLSRIGGGATSAARGTVGKEERKRIKEGEGMEPASDNTPSGKLHARQPSNGEVVDEFGVLRLIDEDVPSTPRQRGSSFGSSTPGSSPGVRSSDGKPTLSGTPPLEDWTKSGSPVGFSPFSPEHVKSQLAHGKPQEEDVENGFEEGQLPSGRQKKGRRWTVNIPSLSHLGEDSIFLPPPGYDASGTGPFGSDEDLETPGTGGADRDFFPSSGLQVATERARKQELEEVLLEEQRLRMQLQRLQEKKLAAGIYGGVSSAPDNDHLSTRRRSHLDSSDISRWSSLMPGSVHSLQAHDSGGSQGSSNTSLGSLSTGRQTLSSLGDLQHAPTDYVTGRKPVSGVRRHTVGNAIIDPSAFSPYYLQLAPDGDELTHAEDEQGSLPNEAHQESGEEAELAEADVDLPHSESGSPTHVSNFEKHMHDRSEQLPASQLAQQHQMQQQQQLMQDQLSCPPHMQHLLALQAQGYSPDAATMNMVMMNPAFANMYAQMSHAPYFHPVGFYPPGAGMIPGMAGALPLPGKQKTGPTGANLFVFNFPRAFTNQDLEAAFAPFGPVLSATVFIDKNTNRSKCFGFVSFEHAESAITAIQSMNGAQLGGKTIKVQLKREMGPGSRNPQDTMASMAS